MSRIEDVPGELVRSISRVVIGKEKQVKLVLTTLLSGGHVLIEDIPGVGKTLLALATARSIGVRFRRVQFTSDTLPSDVIGVNVFDPKTSAFEFKEGPIFTEVLLADEINRTSPRTQSALLEAMAEGKASVDGITYQLPTPFFVRATMNPVERFGSFGLPESQLDRFTMSISVGYPALEDEREILVRDLKHSDAERLEPVTGPEEIAKLQHRARQVRVEDSVMDYLLALIRATREDSAIRLGISSRGGLQLKRSMQALALLDGRDYVVPDDLRQVFIPALVHRILLTVGVDSGSARDRKKEVLTRILQSVESPV